MPSDFAPIGFSLPLPSLSPVRRWHGVRLEQRQIMLEQDLHPIAIDIQDLELAAARGREQMPLAIPIRPLESAQKLDLPIALQPVADPQAVDGLVEPEVTAGPPQAFDTQQVVAAGLALLDAGIAALVPCIAGVAPGRVRLRIALRYSRMASAYCFWAT